MNINLTFEEKSSCYCFPSEINSPFTVQFEELWTYIVDGKWDNPDMQKEYSDITLDCVYLPFSVEGKNLTKFLLTFIKLWYSKYYYSDGIYALFGPLYQFRLRFSKEELYECIPGLDYDKILTLAYEKINKCLDIQWDRILEITKNFLNGLIDRSIRYTITISPSMDDDERATDELEALEEWVYIDDPDEDIVMRLQLHYGLFNELNCTEDEFELVTHLIDSRSYTCTRVSYRLVQFYITIEEYGEGTQECIMNCIKEHMSYLLNEIS